MKHFVISIFDKIVSRYLTAIPIASIRLETTKVPLKEGWGGKSIESFPPYQFFKTYIKGDQQVAKDAMAKWYYERFIRDEEYAICKADGGMQGGSLWRVIAQLHRENQIDLKTDLSNANEALIRKGIKMRVSDRFLLLESIRTKGYYCCWDYIRVKKQDDNYTLIHGNHRVAALAVTGHLSVLAATSHPLMLRLATRLARILLRKKADYRADTPC